MTKSTLRWIRVLGEQSWKWKSVYCWQGSLWWLKARCFNLSIWPLLTDSWTNPHSRKFISLYSSHIDIRSHTESRVYSSWHPNCHRERKIAKFSNINVTPQHIQRDIWHCQKATIRRKINGSFGTGHFLIKMRRLLYSTKISLISSWIASLMRQFFSITKIFLGGIKRIKNKFNQKNIKLFLRRKGSGNFRFFQFVLLQLGYLIYNPKYKYYSYLKGLVLMLH